jgi:hypothetical protein
MIRATRRSTPGAQGIRARAARSISSERFAAVECDGDHLADELSVG